MEEKLIIRGGRPLRGEVRISGAKNATLPIMAASLLTDEPCYVENVPFLRDVDTIIKLVTRLGGKVEKDGHRGLMIDVPTLNGYEAPYDLVKTMRASVLVLGPLLARMGRARVSLPGGCAIGQRPIDQHLKGLKALGAKIELKHGYIEASADRLRGADIYLDIPTVTGTENIMMAGAGAEGVTVIENAACEPEVAELGTVLAQMGVGIEGAGTETIEIEGASSLKGFRHTIIPDRIEAGTFMVASAITGGDVVITDIAPDYLGAVMVKLREAGVNIEEDHRRLRVHSSEKLKPVDVTTLPYPGFPTDMQAQFLALMSLSRGTSIITETVFENRFMHVAELRRMGANISLDGHIAIVRGVEELSGAQVMATDLRASASLILAALAARGETVVSRIYHLDRGYEAMVEKLTALGADIRRV